MIRTLRRVGDRQSDGYGQGCCYHRIGSKIASAKNQQEFWNNLCSKRLHIPNQSQEKGLSGKPEWNDWLGELEDIECFDNEFLKSLLKKAKFMDPQQGLF